MKTRPLAAASARVSPDVITEPVHYGMHRHFTDGCSVVMWGGGMKKGFLYGKTADERPSDVHALLTLLKDLGKSLTETGVFRAQRQP